jgi:hypothetical protein
MTPGVIRNPGEGRTIAVVGDVYRFLATGEDTNGNYAFWEAFVTPGGGPPAHVHSREEKRLLHPRRRDHLHDWRQTPASQRRDVFFEIGVRCLKALPPPPRPRRKRSRGCWLLRLDTASRSSCQVFDGGRSPDGLAVPLFDLLEGRPLVDRQVVGLVALDDVLRLLYRSVPLVAVEEDLPGHFLLDRPSHLSCLRVPFDMIARLEVSCHC